MSSFRTGTDFRKAALNRFFSVKPVRPKPSPGYDMLLSASERIVERAANPVDSLRDFHQRHVLRIIDLYKQNEDSIEIATALADLRKVLTVSAFCIAAHGNQGNYALAMGGSVTTGMHTFLTDVDAVVIAHKPEDRDAAQNVQKLMISVLEKINIEADWAMPMNLDCLNFEILERRFQLISRNELTDPYLKSMWVSNSSVFNFLMDIRIIDVAGDIAKSVYEQRLVELQERRMFSSPAIMFDLCKESYQRRNERIEPEKPFSIKNNAFRLFMDALYAFRAIFHVSDSSPWHVLPLLEKKGILSSDEREEIQTSLVFLLRLRHLIGFAVDDSIDSTKLTDKAIEVLSYILKMEKVELLKKVEISCRRLRDISEKIFLQLEGRENGTGNKPTDFKVNQE